MAGIGGDGMPAFTTAAPALLGFDEAILGYCSELVGLGFDGGDLNEELAGDDATALWLCLDGAGGLICRFAIVMAPERVCRC